MRLRVGGPEVQKRHISWLNLLRPQSRLIPRVGGAFTPHSQAAAVPSLLPPLFLIPLLSEFRKILPSNALHKWGCRGIIPPPEGLGEAAPPDWLPRNLSAGYFYSSNSSAVICRVGLGRSSPAVRKSQVLSGFCACTNNAPRLNSYTY